MTKTADRPQRLWLLTDGKPGHRNQLRGLSERLQAHSEADVEWIDVHRYPVSLTALVRGRGNAPATLQKPDMLIAAGSASHRLLLTWKRQFNCFACVLMKPDFPLSWVDAAIIPEHDGVPARDNILLTRGVVNAVTPVAELPRLARGLILVGGPSKHFSWSSSTVAAQIHQLCRDATGIHWTLADSRRTPAQFREQVLINIPPNTELVPHETTRPDWLPRILGQVRQAWVTPDSVSMVYEALTAGLPTGLFDLAPRCKSRVAEGIDRLRSEHLVTGFSERQRLLTEQQARPELWEAERAALWLLERWRARQ